MQEVQEVEQHSNPEVEERCLTTSWLKVSRWQQEREGEVSLSHTTSGGQDSLQVGEVCRFKTQTWPLRFKA